MFSRKKKIGEGKLDKLTSEILDLHAAKKGLEIEKEQMALELANSKRRLEMQLEEEQHGHKLKLQEEKAVFEREKKIWSKEKTELLERAAREKKEFESSLKRELELSKTEAITLMKLESQQKVKQAEIDKDRVVNDIKTSHSEELSEVKSELAENYYNKLTEAFQEIQLNGDKNSKFVQELALKVFDKVPSARTAIEVDVSTTPALEGSVS